MVILNECASYNVLDYRVDVVVMIHFKIHMSMFYILSGIVLKTGDMLYYNHRCFFMLLSFCCLMSLIFYEKHFE